MKTKFLIFFFLLIFIIVEVIYSRAFRVDQLPNGKVFRCLNCHQSIAGDGPLNPFGEEVSAKFLNQNGDVVWGPELAKLDSDGDGFTNGQELQDPEGKWKIGDKDPGNPDLVSLPGDPGSKPPLKSSSRYNNYFENPFIKEQICAITSSVKLLAEGK